MYWASQSVKIWFFLAGQLGMETYNSQPVHIEWNDTVTGSSANNSYNSILAKLGWPINNGELSSQLAGQQWIKSLKGLSIPEVLVNRNPHHDGKTSTTSEAEAHSPPLN